MNKVPYVFSLQVSFISRAVFFPKMYWNPLMPSSIWVSTMRENLDGNFRPFRMGGKSLAPSVVDPDPSFQENPDPDPGF
jgi:hypothetical protein